MRRQIITLTARKFVLGYLHLRQDKFVVSLDFKSHPATVFKTFVHFKSHPHFNHLKPMAQEGILPLYEPSQGFL